MNKNDLIFNLKQLRKTFGRSMLVSILITDKDVIIVNCHRPNKSDFEDIDISNNDPGVFKNYIG